jgi:hypothetical protein
MPSQMYRLVMKICAFFKNLNFNKTQINIMGSLKFRILPHPQFKTSPLPPSNTDKMPYSFCLENGKESLQNIYNNSNNEGDSALQKRPGDKNISEGRHSWFIIYDFTHKIKRTS